MAAPNASVDTLLVGRDDELASVEAALCPGRGGALLEGDPGIGKSALWRAGVERARHSGALVLESRPGEGERRLSFSALDDLLAAELDAVLPEIPRPQRRALEVALLRVDDPDTTPDPRGVSTAVLEVVHSLARNRHIVLAIDDVQWLDPGSARALDFALRRLDAGSVAVLATRRLGTDISPAPLLRTFDERGISRLRVPPLAASAIEHIVRRQIGLHLSRPSWRRVQELSGGNPLFALELARSSSAEPHWSMGNELPDRLGWAIRRRMGTLPLAVREVLCGAALTRQPSWSRLASVTGHSETEVGDAAAYAQRKGFVVIEPGRSTRDDEILKFRHPLFRSAAAELLPATGVRALHRAYAQIVDDPEELGRHLAASALGPDEEVATALGVASRRARRRGALDASAELSELAARFTPESDRDRRSQRMIAAAGSLFDAGDRTAAEEYLRSRLDEVPPGIQRSRALATLAVMCWNDLVRGGELLDLAESEAGDDPGTREMVLATRAWVEAYGHSLDRAAECAIEAIRLAERHGKPILRASFAVLAWVRLLQGHDATEAITRGLALGSGYVRADQCTPRLSAAMGRRWVGDLSGARELLEAEEAAIYATGAETSLVEVLGPLVEVLWRSGEWTSAADRLRLAAEIAEDVGVTPSRVAQWSHADALLAIGYGQVDKGLDIARGGAAAAASVGDRFSEAHNHAALVLGSLVNGDAHAAATAFATARRLLDELGVREPGVLGVTGDGLEALAAARDGDELARVVAELEETASSGDRPWVAADVARGRAFLLDGDDAEHEMAMAAAGYARLGMPLEAARCELWLGAALRRRRQQRRARETLARAKAAFARLGARPWEARAHAELARIGGRRPPATELTQAETEVAALVAEGRNNSDIASRLHVSVRTVEAHLSHAYAKLGVRSRTALVAKLHDG